MRGPLTLSLMNLPRGRIIRVTDPFPISSLVPLTDTCLPCLLPSRSEGRGKMGT